MDRMRPDSSGHRLSMCFLNASLMTTSERRFFDFAKLSKRLMTAWCSVSIELCSSSTVGTPAATVALATGSTV
ncbi:hypothetical protein AJ88_12735 [Mesorhizobium amorphae CCBAU 01583]|nr:hypothetical protein AJ88_12735 [Mesorhizobium amorphae CCBAU 01583]